jgi:hypothetical protein
VRSRVDRELMRRRARFRNSCNTPRWSGWTGCATADYTISLLVQGVIWQLPATNIEYAVFMHLCAVASLSDRVGMVEVFVRGFSHLPVRIPG